MDNKLAFVGLSIVIGLGFLLAASAQQTSGILPLDSFNHHGTVSIRNVQVVEKEYYKVIHLNIQIQIKDLALEDSAWFEPDSIKLVNENGKSYLPNREECTTTDPPGTLSWPGPCFKVANDCGKPDFSFGIKGTEGGIGNYHPCFRVEKEFNNFNVYYGYHNEFPKIAIGYTQIGDINLNQNAVTTNPDTGNLNSNPAASNPTMSNAQDFFTQLLGWFKNLFKF